MNDTETVARDIKTAYWIGDTVYLRLRADRIPGLVTGVQFYPGNYMYCITWGTGTDTRHYELELTTEYMPDYCP